MKFSYCTNSFRLRPLSDAIEGIAKAGFCAVEIMADRPHAFPEDVTAAQITELIQCVNTNGVKVSNMMASRVSALGDGSSPSWLAEDWEERERRILYTLDSMRLAAAMGIPHITIAPAAPIPSSMNKKEAWRLFLASMHRVLPLSHRLGVQVLVTPEPGSVLESSEEIAALIKELVDYDQTGCRQLRVDFDITSFARLSEEPCEAYEKLAPYVSHIHIGDIAENLDRRRLQLGAGVLDFPKFLRCIETSGYDGFVAVQLDDYEQQAEKAVIASANYLKEKGFLPADPEDCQQ
jgi:sugar phosphate isomerase/epimerase